MDPEDIKEPTTYKSTYKNQLSRVAVVGVVEIILIITTCFKLSIVAAIIEFLTTVGTLCMGYVEQLFATISGSGEPLYTATFEITVISYFVAAAAITNVIMTIMMQVKKNALAKQTCKSHPER